MKNRNIEFFCILFILAIVAFGCGVIVGLDWASELIKGGF